jgi:hypothetical protein
MPPTVKTSDMYECTFYLLKECELVSIEGAKINGKVTCLVTFAHEKINSLQVEYFSGNAMVNLFDFRRAYGQVNALVHTAKRKFKNQLKQQEAQA